MTRPGLTISTRAWRFRTGHLVEIVVVGAVIVAIALHSIQQSRETRLRRESLNHLRSIGIAAGGYDGAHQSLPPGMTRDADRFPLQSWQTLLLPHLGQDPVYRSIRLESPWNDPVNREACSTRIIEYVHPAAKPAVMGGYPVTHYAGNSQVLLPDRTLRIAEIRDGTSNVIFSGDVEVGPIPWAQPGNVRDPADGLGLGAEQFGRRQSSNRIAALFLMLDGSVRYFDDRTDLAIFKGLATPAGDEPQILWP